MNSIKEEVAQITNKGRIEGKLEEVVVCADVFIGVSAAGANTRDG